MYHNKLVDIGMNSNENIRLGSSFTLRNIILLYGNKMITNGNLVTEEEVELSRGVEIRAHAMNFSFTIFNDGFEVTNSPLEIQLE